MFNLFYEIPESYRGRVSRRLKDCHNRWDSGGGETETVTTSNLDPAQIAMLEAASGQITPRVKAGATATPYTGQLTVEPDKRVVDLISRYLDNPSLLGESDISNLDNLVSGKPAYTYDAKTYAEQWKNDFVKPVMNSWNSYVLPGLYETMNIVPGSLADTNVSKALASKSNEFFESSVLPTLYNSEMAMQQLGIQSAENAKTNQLGALQFKSGLAASNLGTATTINDWLNSYKRSNQSNLYQEAQRMMPENSNWLKMALGYGTIPTMSSDTVVQQGSGLTNSLIGLGGSLGSAAIISSALGGTGGGYTNEGLATIAKY